jgi:hypothetical protein
MFTATRSTARLPLGVGAIGLTMAGFVLVPAATAQAAENVSSSYQLGCSIFPEDGQKSSAEPAGVSFSGVRQGMSASPESHTLYGRSLSIYPTDTTDTGEDCDGRALWSDRLTVGAGTSGADDGDVVPVTVTVRFDGGLYGLWNASGPFLTNAHYDARLSVVSLDDCEYSDDEGQDVCDTPVSFTTTHEHEIEGQPSASGDPNGYVQVEGVQEHSFTTNTGVDDSQSTSEDGLLCEAFGCDLDPDPLHPDGQAPQQFTATANLRVGSSYSLEAALNMLSQAYRDSGVQGEVNVDEFSLAITPGAGSDGIDLHYASQGELPPPPADTTPPAFHGVRDITVPAGPDGTAVVTYPFTVDDDVDATPTVTCTPPSGSRFSSRSYPVLCRATDDAGNTSQVTFTVSLTDELPPVIGPMPDLTATATAWGTAVVNWTVPASDNMGTVTVGCTPPSGTAFPVGQTRVSCVATDGAGHTASRSFLVTVAPAPGNVFDRLYEVIRTSHVNSIYKTVLLVSVRVVHSQYDAGNTRSGCTLLGLLDDTIRAADGRAIPTAEARVMESLIYEARYKYNCH